MNFTDDEAPSRRPDQPARTDADDPRAHRPPPSGPRQVSTLRRRQDQASYPLHEGTFVSDELYKALLVMVAPLYIADRRGHLIYANPAFHDLAARIFDDDGENGGHVLEETPTALGEIFERLESEASDEIVTNDVAARGTSMAYYSGRHFPLTDASGLTVAYVGVYTDVTDRAEANRRLAQTQARYEDVIRSASDWVWETDHNLNLTFASNRIAETLGEPAETLTGRYLGAIGRFEDDSDGPRAPDRLIGRRKPFRGAAFVVTDGSGDTHRIRLSGVPVFNSDSGRFIGYRGTGTDVTRQVAAENTAVRAREELEVALESLKARNRDLDEALKRAQAAAHSKSEFLAMMSHELRTPLNAIIGFSEMSLTQIYGPLGEKYSEYFRDIARSAHHLLETVDSILALADLEGTDTIASAKSEPMALDGLLNEAAKLVSANAAERGFEIEIGPVPAGLDVLGDPVRARQIFVNLLGNAVKFTDKGGRIGIDVARPKGEMVDITVWDTGVGITPEQQAKIFDSFYQGEQSAFQAGPGGLGIGLTISRFLAEMMGGTISVESTEGQGARFTVTLPCRRQGADA